MNSLIQAMFLAYMVLILDLNKTRVPCGKLCKDTDSHLLYCVVQQELLYAMLEVKNGARHGHSLPPVSWLSSWGLGHRTFQMLFDELDTAQQSAHCT